MDTYTAVLHKWLFDPMLGRVVTAVIGLIILQVVVKFMHRSLEGRSRTPELRYRLHKAIKIFGYLVSVAFVAAVFADYLGHWTVALGVAGAGIAFALQEVITSIAGWVAISFGGFFTLGDRVQLGGIKGDVIDIGILRTTVMEIGEWVQGDQYNGRIVRVANSFIFKEPVYNYSGDFPFVWDEIVIPIHHGNDAASVRSLLLKVAEEVVGSYAGAAAARWKVMTQKYMIENAVVQPMVLLAVTDNWLEFTLRYVVEYRQRRVVRDRLFSRILEEIERAAGKITIASSTTEVTLARPATATGETLQPRP